MRYDNVTLKKHRLTMFDDSTNFETKMRLHVCAECRL